ncbi:family 43 glycosylhydrolase [Marivirga lumbricoides]
MNKAKFLKLNFLYTLILMQLGFTSCKSDDGGDKQHTPTPPPISEVDSTFTNPIVNNGPDPWVYQYEKVYYYTHTMGNRIGIYKTDAISELGEVRSTTVWTPPASGPYSKNIWAPELHRIDEKWYFYFAADDGDDKNHRMFVIENDSPDPTVGTWEFKGQVTSTSDKWAIDGTVFDYEGQLYFIWSGWRGDDDPGIQQLYIAKMTNPWTIEGDRVMISEPTYDWEKNGLVNEGPQILRNKNDEVFLIYSASGCWTDDYKLGMLTLNEGGDPLNPDDWQKKSEPVFSKKPEHNAYGPGHNSFFKSPDGTEDWIIYHANPESGQGCGNNRSTRIQKFEWTEEGAPDFGEPVRINTPLDKPSGEVTE